MYEDQLTLVEREVRSLAEAMPAEAYDFAPRRAPSTASARSASKCDTSPR